MTGGPHFGNYAPMDVSLFGTSRVVAISGIDIGSSRRDSNHRLGNSRGLGRKWRYMGIRGGRERRRIMGLFGRERCGWRNGKRKDW